MAESGLSKPPPSGDHEPAPKPKRYWWRFSLGSVIIVVAVAAATSASILLYIGSIATALSHHNVYNAKLHRYLSKVNGGEPENILILGSDKRANLAEDPGRSDTTILLRLDPDREAIAVMSIPRDLKVEIPGYGTEKFNAAYTFGGPKLTLQVVKELTGLQINHVVNVDFLGFVRAVDAIGCVYTDVDRRYYHSNVGVPASEQYSEINIKPGYQLLCGKKALEYVRYRHTDTDIVRSARQQDFLSSARERVPISKLVLGQNDLVDIFTKYTTSDISDTETMLQVLKLFVASRNAALKEVHFPAELGPSYVYASPEAIHEAVDKFLGIEASAGPLGRTRRRPQRKPRSPARRSASTTRRRSRISPRRSRPAATGWCPLAKPANWRRRASRGRSAPAFPFSSRRGCRPAPTTSKAIPMNTSKTHASTTCATPTKSATAPTAWWSSGRSRTGSDYFGLQGIQGWSDPPILDSPSLTKTINGREYDIYVDGDRISLVAWHRGNNSYWVANDLLNTLSNDQMMGIARSADVKVPNPKRRRGKAKR